MSDFALSKLIIDLKRVFNFKKVNREKVLTKTIQHINSGNVYARTGRIKTLRLDSSETQRPSNK